MRCSMVNVCVICGEIDSEPEFRMQQEQLHSVTFNVDICDQGESYGWVKVFCLKEHTEAAARLRKGIRVLVVGRLIRGSRKAGEEIWWEEVMVLAKALDIIE
jgi:single-stranded DNA-binding protein